jgi:inorganic pyrophosphatase
MALVLEPTFLGVRSESAGGHLLREDQGLPDHKVIGVPWGDPRYESIADVTDLPEHQRFEPEHFFTVYKQLEKKKTRPWGGGRHPMRLDPRRALARYKHTS